MVPGSIRLLTAAGVRGHALIFSLILVFLFSTAAAAQLVGSAQAWTAIFIVGASSAGTYLLLTALSLLDRTRKHLLESSMKIRAVILSAMFGSIIAGLSYWVNQTGSVEALPIFPVFIAVFYGWILLQSYFIAAPVSHLLTRAETAISGQENRKKVLRTLGTTVLFVPIIPLLYGVWAVSTWANSQYQDIQGSANEILAWTILIILAIAFTYLLTLRWSWGIIRKTPQTALFTGGIFLLLWSYLLYRASSLLMGYVTQSHPSTPIIDAALILVSIIGAMQTLAGKLSKKSEGKLGQILPFLIFSFGSVYAVAQFYFILQFAITRIELSIAVNATVFVTGLLIMMIMIKRHITMSGSPVLAIQSLSDNEREQTGTPLPVKHSFLQLLRKKKTEEPKPSSDDKTAHGEQEPNKPQA